MKQSADITRRLPPKMLPRGITIYAQTFHPGPGQLKDIVGFVERNDKGGYLRIKRTGEESGHSYWIPSAWIESVDDTGVHLNKTIDEVNGGMLGRFPAETRRVA